MVTYLLFFFFFFWILAFIYVYWAGLGWSYVAVVILCGGQEELDYVEDDLVQIMNCVRPSITTEKRPYSHPSRVTCNMLSSKNQGGYISPSPSPFPRYHTIAHRLSTPPYNSANNCHSAFGSGKA